MPWSDDPIPDFGIHPCQLYPGHASRNQTIEIHFDVVSRALTIAIENLPDGRPRDELNSLRIFAVRQIAIDSMDKPK